MGRGLTLGVCLAAALVGCEGTSPCEYDTDCGEGQGCAKGACEQLELPASGACESDGDCSAGELCYNTRCIGESFPYGQGTCPGAPLSEELVCSDWDQDACPCYAGVVSFHEKDEGGRLSCAGVVGIFSQFIYLKQSGCYLAALDDQLTGDAVGSAELRLRIAKLPNDTCCTASLDTWIPEGATEGRPAVRISCSEACTIWMEQFPTPPPERIIPDTSFTQGPPPELLPPDRPDEAPAHRVDLTCYYLDRFEVSRRQYLQCLEVGACSAPRIRDPADLPLFFREGALAFPMTMVTAVQAEEFCRFMEKSLPTEAEWERATRPGRYGQAPWPWGEAPPFDESGAPDCTVASFAACADGARPVDNGGGDTFRAAGASYYGVVDLAGNVREWTRDYYRADAYALFAAEADRRGARNPEVDDPGPLGKVRVVRGGSYRSEVLPAAAIPADDLRRWARDHEPEDAALPDLGFRCARYKPGVAR